MDEETIVGSSGDDFGITSVGDETFTIVEGENILDGGDGTDTVVFPGAMDSYDIIPGADYVQVSDDGSNAQLFNMEYLHFSDQTVAVADLMGAVETIDGSDGGDDLGGDTTDDYMDGGAGDDSIDGGAGDDELFGGDGADTLEGGEGLDTLAGGLGDDFYVVDSDSDLVQEVDDGGIDTEQAWCTDTLADFLENLFLMGSGDLDGFGNDLDNILNGNDGSNELYGDFGDDDLDGGAGSDSLDGGEGDDELLGGDGDDSLIGGSGMDTLDGGLGDDVYVVDADSDQVLEADDGGIDSEQAWCTDTLADFVENLFLMGSGDLDGFGNDLDNLLAGNDGSNDLAGELGDDDLDGGAGDDNLDGGEGNDELLGGEGSDSLVGGAGVDTLDGGLGDDVYVVDAESDQVLEADAGGIDTEQAYCSDTLADFVENLLLMGSEDWDGTGNDLDNAITGNDGGNDLAGELGDDELDGGAGNDSLDGGDGADSLVGGAGVDTLDGGLGDDVYVVDSADDVVRELTGGGIDTERASCNDTLADFLENLILLGSAGLRGSGNGLNNRLTGNGGNNVLNGEGGNDSLAGGIGADTLSGGSGADSLAGGDGADSLSGGTGTDTLVGGAGDDVYVVDSADDVVRELTGGGIDTERASCNDTLADFLENLILLGSAGLRGSGNGLNNRLTGNGGDNVLNGEGGNDSLAGGIGADTLSGGSGADSLAGGDGADSLSGGTGTDTLVGGAGGDVYVVDSADDVVRELTGGGIDTERASCNDTLADFLENLILLGSAGLRGSGNGLNNRLTGNSGNNVLNGEGGNDSLAGGIGADTLSGGSGADSLAGGDGADSLSGGIGIDTLAGGSGNDSLAGGDGNDLLRAGTGVDTLAGGNGNDIFDFDFLAEIGSTSTTGDIITDFIHGQDRIDLSSIDANSATPADDRFTGFVGPHAAFTAAGQLRFVGGVLYGNTDGDADAEFAIRLTGLGSLVTGDLIL